MTLYDAHLLATGRRHTYHHYGTHSGGGGSVTTGVIILVVALVIAGIVWAVKHTASGD